MKKLTPDDQKKAAAIGGFVLLAAGILYYQLSDSSPTPRPIQPPVVTQAPTVNSNQSSSGTAAKNLGTTSAQLDPSLRMGPMLAAERVDLAVE